jgi:hypothetical protein
MVTFYTTTTTFGHPGLLLRLLDRLLMETSSPGCPLFHMSKNDDIIKKILAMPVQDVPALLASLLPRMKDLAKEVEKRLESQKTKQ